MRIAILGAGSWGTALGLSLAAVGHRVTWWSRHPEVVASIHRHGRHPFLFPDIPSPVGVAATQEMAAVSDSDCVLVMVSSQGCRSVLAQLQRHYHGVIVLGAKGVESETDLFPHQIAESLGFSSELVCAISGPAFARDVVDGLPTVLNFACLDQEKARDLSSCLSSSQIRLCPTSDVLGVEFCGAIKNSLAIAAGMSDGLCLGAGARATIITFGLSEARCLARALGISDDTVFGLSGLGDLVLTATSHLSRNWRLGHAVGQGQPIDDCLRQLGEVTEGLVASYCLERIAKNKGVSLPVINSLCAVFRGSLSPRDSLHKIIFQRS